MGSKTGNVELTITLTPDDIRTMFGGGGHFPCQLRTCKGASGKSEEVPFWFKPVSFAGERRGGEESYVMCPRLTDFLVENHSSTSDEDRYTYDFKCVEDSSLGTTGDARYKHPKCPWHNPKEGD